jgi:hypothetical protein
MAVMNGATGPKLSQSAPISATTPERIAKIPFQNVDIEKVEEIQSAGNTFLSVCSHTYHASKVENRMDVATPPVQKHIRSCRFKYANILAVKSNYRTSDQRTTTRNSDSSL